MPKEKRSFDWTKAEFEHCLVKFAYIGTNYYGLATQSSSANSAAAGKGGTHDPSQGGSSGSTATGANPNRPTPPPTVEDELFGALEKVTLVSGRAELLKTFSRCGRTDKGVHAAGNYFSGMLRRVGGGRGDEPGADPRIRMLNRVLPSDIRVKCVWVLPPRCGPEVFSARFSCLYRVYKYYFVNHGKEGGAGGVRFDLERMEEAAAHLVGEHDFRNFCKMDLSQTTNFVRRILSVSVKEVQHVSRDAMHPLPPTGTAGDSLVEVEIKGLSFLWHQIRCIMTVLFLVAEGKESPSVVTGLLDKSQFFRGKPNYDLADEAGLVLYDCAYELPGAEGEETGDGPPSAAASEPGTGEGFTSAAAGEPASNGASPGSTAASANVGRRRCSAGHREGGKGETTLHRGRRGLYTALQRQALRKAAVLACLDGTSDARETHNPFLEPPGGKASSSYVTLVKRARAPPLEDQLEAYNAKLREKATRSATEATGKEPAEGEAPETEVLRENHSEAYNDKDVDRMEKIRRLGALD